MLWIHLWMRSTSHEMNQGNSRPSCNNFADCEHREVFLPSHVRLEYKLCAISYLVPLLVLRSHIDQITEWLQCPELLPTVRPRLLISPPRGHARWWSLYSRHCGPRNLSSCKTRLRVRLGHGVGFVLLRLSLFEDRLITEWNRFRSSSAPLSAQILLLRCWPHTWRHCAWRLCAEG